MHRRKFVLTAAAGFAWPRLLLAQAKVWRIGYLSMTSPDADRVIE